MARRRLRTATGAPLRLAFLVAIILLVALPLSAQAQQAGKVYEMGLLVIVGRYSEGRDERYPDLAADLVRLQVDVIVAAAQPALRADQVIE